MPESALIEAVSHENCIILFATLIFRPFLSITSFCTLTLHFALTALLPESNWRTQKQTWKKKMDGDKVKPLSQSNNRYRSFIYPPPRSRRGFPSLARCLRGYKNNQPTNWLGVNCIKGSYKIIIKTFLYLAVNHISLTKYSSFIWETIKYYYGTTSVCQSKKIIYCNVK